MLTNYLSIIPEQEFPNFMLRPEHENKLRILIIPILESEIETGAQNSILSLNLSLRFVSSHHPRYFSVATM